MLILLSESQWRHGCGPWSRPYPPDPRSRSPWTREKIEDYLPLARIVQAYAPDLHIGIDQGEIEGYNSEPSVKLLLPVTARQHIVGKDERVQVARCEQPYVCLGRMTVGLSYSQPRLSHEFGQIVALSSPMNKKHTRRRF
jgi:hypothetical protein